jgi:uncharacterized protein YecT (DUF1311 family)
MIANRRLKTVALCFALHASPSYAIDNPDANNLETFLATAEHMETSIDEVNGTTNEYVRHYRHYEELLDVELNKAYSALMSDLEASEKEALKASQKAWIKFRDQEFEFQTQNWTQNRFGTSSRLSIAQYRCALIKARVVQLLHYLGNY